MIISQCRLEQSAILISNFDLLNIPVVTILHYYSFISLYLLSSVKNSHINFIQKDHDKQSTIFIQPLCFHYQCFRIIAIARMPNTCTLEILASMIECYTGMLTIVIIQ